MYLIRETIYRGRRVPAVLWPDTDPTPGNDRSLTLIRIRDGKVRAIAVVWASMRDGRRWLRVERGGPDAVLSSDRFSLRFRDGERGISRPIPWGDLLPCCDPVA